MSMLTRLKGWAKKIKRGGVTLWFALKHPQTPLRVKALAMFVVAYALSPIDLIPDFIPVLGYLDDLILLPGLIWLALRLLPVALREGCAAQADAWIASGHQKPVSFLGAALVVVVWMAAAYAGWRWWWMSG